jgi:hypothetical protein
MNCSILEYFHGILFSSQELLYQVRCQGVGVGAGMQTTPHLGKIFEIDCENPLNRTNL